MSTLYIIKPQIDLFTFHFLYKLNQEDATCNILLPLDRARPVVPRFQSL